MFRRHVVHSQERLTIRSECHGHAHVLQLIGELDMNTAPAFENELKRVEDTEARQIIVDLSWLKLIGCDGLKILIHANARLRDAGNRLVLVRGADQVQRTFEMTGLISRLPFADDVDVRSLLHVDTSRNHLGDMRGPAPTMERWPSSSPPT